jgi:hypothetical protein
VVLIYLVLLLGAAHAEAKSVLLAKFHAGGGSGFTSPSGVAGLSFTLGFGPLSANGVCNPVLLGCDLILPITSIQAGDSFDFEPTAPGFADLVAHLTNGVDELLQAYQVVYNASGQVVGGGGIGNFESFGLKGLPDLAGRKIDLVRVRVLSFVFAANDTTYNVQADLIWEFWGKGKPLPLLPDGPVAARIDAFIDRSRPNTNEGANEVLLAGAPGPTRAIVSFDLPRVPDTVISEALLVLTLIEPAAGWPDGGGILNAHRLKAVIQEGDGMNWGRVQREGDGVGVTWNCRRDRHIENDWPDCGHRWSGGDHRVGTPAIIFDPLRIENGITGQIVCERRGRRHRRTY